MAIAKLSITAIDKDTHSVDEVSLGIQSSDNVQNDFYNNGMLNEKGVDMLQITLSYSVTSLIHYAHQFGYKDSAKMLREIIEDLESGFVQQVTVNKEGFEGSTHEILNRF